MNAVNLRTFINLFVFSMPCFTFLTRHCIIYILMIVLVVVVVDATFTKARNRLLSTHRTQSGAEPLEILELSPAPVFKTT